MIKTKTIPNSIIKFKMQKNTYIEKYARTFDSAYMPPKDCLKVSAHFE